MRSVAAILASGTPAEREWAEWYLEAVAGLLGPGVDPSPKAEEFWRLTAKDALRLDEALGSPTRAERLAMIHIRLRFGERDELLALGWTLDGQGHWRPPPGYLAPG